MKIVEITRTNEVFFCSSIIVSALINKIVENEKYKDFVEPEESADDDWFILCKSLCHSILVPFGFICSVDNADPPIEMRNASISTLKYHFVSIENSTWLMSTRDSRVAKFFFILTVSIHLLLKY